MKDTAIVSYAKNGREHYSLGLSRMAMSANDAGYTGQFILCSPDVSMPFNEPGLPIPDHHVVPYGFKTEMVKIARDRGFKKVIWFDSTVFMYSPATKPPAAHRLYDLLNSSSIMAFDNPGCPESHWTSDDALAQMGAPMDDILFNQCMACVLGFNFDNPIANEVFDEWYALSKDGISFKGASGSTRPEFRAHRHDQACISYLLRKRKIGLVPYGTLCYWSDRIQFADNVLVCNRGIGQP